MFSRNRITFKKIQNIKRFCNSSAHNDSNESFSVLGMLTYVSVGVLTYSTIYTATVSQAYLALTAKLITAEKLGIDVKECKRKV